jgi:uncharacterized protein (DUF849 family)
MSPQPVFLSCAITGGMSVPGQSAAIPVTPLANPRGHRRALRRDT